MRPILVAALFVPAAALAVAPQKDLPSGAEPGRIVHTHPAVQASMQLGEDWRAFVGAEGAGWHARFDETTGVPRRMWGPGIGLGVRDAAGVERAVLALVERHAGLFGVDPAELRTRSVRWVERTDTWYVDVDVLVAGAPIERAGLTFRVVGDALVMAGADTFPGVPVRGVFRIDAATAVAAAVDGGPAPTAAHTDLFAERVVLPVDEGDDGLGLVPVWRVTSRTEDPPGRWVVYVDADTGSVRTFFNEVRFVEGTVMGRHDRRTVDGEMTTSPLPWLPVMNVEGDETTTDEHGAFTLPDSTGYGVAFDGEVRVYNEDGAEATPTSVGSDLLVTASQASQAEIDTWVFVNQVRDFWYARTPEVAITHAPLRVYVNVDSSCNAWYDGDLNFLRAGSGCNNTARIADVNYHEWGHGFHDYSLQAGWFDGSLSEGAADVVATLLTDDPVIGPWFYTNGSGIRSVSPDRRYPDDYYPYEDYVHENGLIFGGAMWDLRGILAADLGADEAREATAMILAGLLKGGPDIERSYEEAMLADDDDADLGNGTPHDCAIIEAFGRHGLGPQGSGGDLTSGHIPLEDQPEGADHLVDVALESPFPHCFDYQPERAEVYYRVDGSGGWKTVALTDIDGGYEAAIPAQPAGSFVEYYIEFDDASGSRLAAPTGGRINPYTFYVGGVIPVHCDDFEDGDGGYVHTLTFGADEEGADDWQWGRPQGQGYDPSDAASGNKVWANDLGKEGWNGEYQNDRGNRLTSPTFETGHYQGVFLQYRRWLSVEDGFYDQATILADDEPVWSNWSSNDAEAGEHTIDGQWVPHVVDLGGRADDGSITIAFDLRSDAGLSFGGWTIDDVCLMAPATPDNRLGIVDFDAEAGEGTVSLSWTNPPHAPLAAVRVVRRSGRWPTGPEDGVVVFEDTQPSLGGAAVADDLPFGTGGIPLYYAVYASDGADWLSWTVEGWNADTVDGMGEAGTADGVSLEGSDGCGGCNGTGSPTGWLALLGLIGLRRRR